ncbi:MAG TPA: ABC transporter permease [Blastocatellia bacterium]|nr:ABC transporter permease [Blastocatellia bacterium]
MFAGRKDSLTKPHLWLIRVIGVIVPRRLRADWRQEWEAELRYREASLAEWDRLDWRTKLELLRRSLGAFRDALLLQPIRLEDEMFQDMRYGLRMLLKSPNYTLMAALSLALGIGANTAIFSLIDALMLRSLPVREPEKLVLFGKGEGVGATNNFPDRSWDLFSYPFYREMRRSNEVFSDIGATLSMSWAVHGVVDTNVTGGEIARPERIDVQPVSGSYFSTLGVNAGLGRVITDADDQVAGAHPVAVISHAWWESRLGADPAAIGKTVTIDKIAYTIIGVAPKEFFGATVGQAPDLWIPLAMEAQLPPGHWNGRENPEWQSLYLIARLKNGVSAEQASAAVNQLFKQSLLERAGAQASNERSQDIRRARIELTQAGRGLSRLRREFSLSLRILMAVVGVVLLIACANVANLLLARAAARQKEFAVRLALGAGRARLIRQLLTESVLLAGLGAAAGVFLAWLGGRLLVLMASTGLEPLPLDVTPNARILGFTLLASLLSAIIFGTAPALRAARIEPNSSLKSGKGASHAASRSRFGKLLVVAQVALSLVLLVGAGLFVRTLINLQNLPSGFNQQSVMVFRIGSTATGYKGAQLKALLGEIEEKVKAVPGVQAASFSLFVFQGGWSSSVFTRDQIQPEGQSRLVWNNKVGPDFFAAMGIPLLEGRVFGPQDTDRSQQVAVISETMARRFFPNGSPLGKRFGRGGPENSGQFEVIGVVKDAKYESLTEEWRPIAYYPYSQSIEALGAFVARYSGSPESVTPQVRRAVSEVDRNLPIDEVISLSEHVGRSLVQQRLVARLASFFSALALLLACVGLYGVLSYSVARRTNEIGIRMALGAQRGDVLWLAMREALTLVVAGVVIGLLASMAATQTFSTFLFGLEPNDPLTIVGATLLLIALAALASYLPARRAARISPMAAVREE